jgi:hypothetical protein
MSEETAVRRDIDVPLPLDDVWPLVAGGDGWTEWLVEEADVAVEPGAAGTVVDDGARRELRVDEVVAGERVAWTWWPAGRPADASRVELVVIPAADHTLVRITETSPASRWDRRARLLAAARVSALAA